MSDSPPANVRIIGIKLNVPLPKILNVSAVVPDVDEGAEVSVTVTG